MTCCNALGECSQSTGCVCHETPIDDVVLESDGTQAHIGFLLCCLSAVVMTGLIIFGVTR